jgi:hypothetical protein
MRYFVPSLSSVLALLVVGLLGFCLLQREELQYVRGENELLVQKTEEVEDLLYQIRVLHARPAMAGTLHEGGQ